MPEVRNATVANYAVPRGLEVRIRTTCGPPSRRPAGGPRSTRAASDGTCAGLGAAGPDEPVPALDGLTPRQAARRPEARRRLVALLQDLGMSEARERPSRRFDIDELRRELGIRDQ